MAQTHGLTVLGINRTQDASICLVRDDEVLVAIAKERITRHKHDWGALGDFEKFYVPNIPQLLEYPIHAVVECFSTQKPAAAQRQEYRAELRSSLRLAPDVQFLDVSHHYAHLYSAFDPSGFTDSAAMIIDAQGSHLDDLTEEWVSDTTDPRLREIMSFYRCQQGVKTCLGKQAWDGTPSAVAGLGMFYNLMTRTMFSGEGNEGKVMGLAPWGSAERAGLPPLSVQDYRVYFPDRWKSVLVHSPVRHHALGSEAQFLEAADFAAAGQKAFEDAVVAVACWLYEATGLENLCFAGGTALNCSANTRLLTDTPFKRLFIPPAPHDCGVSLGCALYGMERLTGRRNNTKWLTDYLGPSSGATVDLPDEQAFNPLVMERPPSLWEEVADRLAAGQTVGVAQGRSEFGPRALGHRSILADPRGLEMKSHINRDIKGREWFRPLAPVVPLDEVNTYFELEGACPFMQWTAIVRSEYRDRIPAVVHCDGTARLQTVTREQNPELYQLLKMFRARSGIGVLLNTSFNGKDEPIVESTSDVLRCFKNTPLDAVVMPPLLISKPLASRTSRSA